MTRIYTDEKLAKFATPTWIDSVAAVPLDEAAVMIAEDPSVLTTLIGAVRFTRAALAETTITDLVLRKLLLEACEIGLDLAVTAGHLDNAARNKVQRRLYEIRKAGEP
jgi:hypothetical protein